MAKITYLAPKGDDRVVTYMGHEFFHGQAVEIDDPVVVKKASGNAHFEVEGADEAAADVDKLSTVKERGAKAKAEGKERSVPPAYRGKPEETSWLSGYDEASGEA